MRLFYILVLVVITIIEVGPIPITPVVLIYVVLFRPKWLYELVLKIFDKE
jgi:hypothetical protein